MFGMGTGGSLRLLSPESSRARSLLLPPFCPRQSAVEWPPDFLSAALKEWGFHGFSIRGGLAALASLHVFASRVPASVALRFLRFRSGFGIVHAVRTLKTAQAADFSLSDQDFLPSASLSHSALALASVCFRSRSCAPFRFLPLLTNPGLDQALDRLVSSSFIRCRTFTDDLSTSSSLRGLTCF